MARYAQYANAVKIDDGHTALHIAAANDHLDIVCLLASLVSLVYCVAIQENLSKHSMKYMYEIIFVIIPNMHRPVHVHALED